MGDTFPMATRDGMVSTPCTIVGALAVHKIERGYWRISHVQTGYYTGLWGRSRKEAVAVAEAANESFPTWGAQSEDAVCH